MTRLTLRSLALSAFFLSAGEAHALETSGDLRVGYDAAWRDTRDGRQTDADAFTSRFRYRIRHAWSDRWRFQTRLATSWADRANDPEVYLRSHREFGTAVEPGTTTLDELFVQYTAPSSGTEIRIGRFQSNLDLPNMATRSFDRSQASSVNIGWTDGISVRHPLGNWYGEGVLQYNGPDGNGQATRGPLTFDDSGSRVSFFGVLGSDAELGPIFMRALSLTVYPDALATAGTASPEREDYVLAAFKLGAGWDVGDAGRRLVAVGEVAHAFDTPLRSTIGLPGEGRVDGWGWQAGLDLVNIFPRSTWGVNYGQSDGGMLISNDFRQNNELAEFRWQYYATASLRVEFRARWRRELTRRADAAFLLRDRDMRLRMTYRF